MFEGIFKGMYKRCAEQRSEACQRNILKTTKGNVQGDEGCAEQYSDICQRKTMQMINGDVQEDGKGNVQGIC